MGEFISKSEERRMIQHLHGLQEEIAKLRAERDRLHASVLDMQRIYDHEKRSRIANAEAVQGNLETIAKLKAERDAAVKERDALLMAVHRKFPNETRFQTALRYIREAEARTALPTPDTGETKETTDA